MKNYELETRSHWGNTDAIASTSSKRRITQMKSG